MNKSSKIFYGNLTYENALKEYLKHNKILNCNHIVRSNDFESLTCELDNNFYIIITRTRYTVKNGKTFTKYSLSVIDNDRDCEDIDFKLEFTSRSANSYLLELIKHKQVKSFLKN